MTAESIHGSDIFADRRLARNPIAIVGMSGLLPKATSHREYWQNIMDGVDCTEEVPQSRWSLEDYYDADKTVPDKTYSNRGAFLPDVDFDPLEFGLPPNQLEVTSTMQTLSLGVARDLLADAGATGSSWYDPSRTGVVLGTTGPVPLMHPLAARLSTPVLKEAARSCGLSESDVNAIADKFVTAFAPWEENSFPGLLANVVAGRIANRFGLGGINCTVDAACAASLAAIRTAIAELQDGRADTMITGGVDTENSIFIYLCFSKVGALSPTGQISPFSNGADGTLLGEGISMLALRRLSDAQRDGNRIYAVIKGLGSSSDGRSKSIYAPRAEGQRVALDRAYVDAECSPSSVELFEAHATGTAVGDRTELEALGGLLTDSSDETAFAAVGSVKSQIGHTKGAAGTASMMKVALGLYHKVLPGTINVTAPNAEIDTQSPFYVNTATRPWIRDPQRPVRRGAVSAMGFGGTNFHIVLEETDAPRREQRVLHETPSVHVWHATDIDTLIEQVRSAESVGGGDIPADHARVGFVSVDDEDEAQLRELAVEQLERNRDAEHWTHPEGLFFRRRALPGIKVGALFAGQGSQYVDMGTDAALNNPSVAEAFDLANEAFADAPTRLGRVVFPPPVFDDRDRVAQETELRRTEFAQPAIGALSAGQFRFFQELGFVADGYLGHSFGELTALWASGALSSTDFFALARARGAAMAPTSAEDSGTMLAVAATRDKVDALIAGAADIRICNHNAPDQVVVGGGTDAVAAFADRCAEEGVATRELPVSAAFHTPYVAHAVEAFRPAVQAVRIGTPDAPIYANSPGAQYGSDESVNSSTLIDQLLNPVEFVTALETMRAAGCTVFVEFGPKKVLTSLVRRTLGDDVVAIATDSGPVGSSDLSLKRAAAQLLVLGVRLGDVNHYNASTPVPAVGSGMTVTLSAPEYTPEVRKKAYASALADGYQVSTSAPPAPLPPTAPLPTVEPSIAPVAPRPSETIVSQPVPNSIPAQSPSDVESALTSHLDTHDHYLDGQLDLARQLASALNSGHLDDGMVRAIEAVKDHGVAISHSHTRASEVLGQLAELEFGGTSYPPSTVVRSTTRVADPAPAVAVDSAPARVALAPAPAPMVEKRPAQVPTVVAVSEAVAGVTAAQLRAALVDVVAEKTGYPAEMVDPTMDLEADLGVDSIKRVQVLGAVQERFPSLPSLGPEQLGTLRTLDQIVDLLAESAADSVHTPSSEPAQEAAEPATTEPAGGADAVRAALLDVIADKTGYPAEMVDPTMDLEADLGVDSIKRVQVLGAVQERFPHLPSLGPEQLGTLRTLNDIVAILAVGSDVHPKADAAATSPRHTVELVALPPIDRIASAFHPDASAVVADIGDTGTAADALAAELDARGWSVRRRTFSGTLEEIESAAAAAADAEADLSLLVVGNTSDWATAQHLVSAALVVAKHSSTTERATDSDAARSAFVAVARVDGALGHLGDIDPVSALVGGIGGIVKTLAAERRSLFCRYLDVHPALGDSDLVDAVLGEIEDAAVDTLEVGIGEWRERCTLVPSLHGPASSRSVVDVGAARENTVLTESDVVLVTGGARGVTALCVRELGRVCDAQFVLLGRTEPAPEPDWAHGILDADLQPAALTALAGTGATPRDIRRVCADVRAGREIRSTLADLGERARYRAVDITDPEAVRDVVGPLAADITAVVHGAGVLADSMLASKTIDEVTRVLNPKIGGLGAVLDALDAAGESSSLRHLILFTSVAGLYGNSGQSDYAAANEALTRFAAAWKHRYPDRHVTAIDWGAWDGGMVTAELREHFLGRGVSLLDPVVGARAFADQFTPVRADDVVVLVGDDASLTDSVAPDRGEFIARRTLDGIAENTLVAAHRIGVHAVLPATFGLGAMINVIERAYPGTIVTTVRDFVVHKGIVFDRPISDIDIRVVPQNDHEVRVMVLGVGGGALPVSHYAATFDLGEYPATARPLVLPHFGDGSSADELYRGARQFHAPPLHGMRNVLAESDDRLVLECEMPASSFALGAFGGILHDPVLADVILQGPPVLGHRLLQSACLPLGIGRIDYYAALPVGEPYIVVVDNPRARATDVTIDATAVGPDGTVLQKFTDVTVVTTPDLSDMFRESVRQWTTS